MGASCTLESSSSSTIFAASADNCYCASLSISDIIKSSALVTRCSDYLKARSIQIAMSVLSGVCITIINTIIKQIFISLGKFQRYDTVSREAAATTIKYFFSLFLNTAIIPILANSDIYGFQLSKQLVQLFINDTSQL